MRELPRGTVTFLFTDIEGSTVCWERDRQAMAAAVARHIALLDAAIQVHDGVHFKTIGDAVQAAFAAAPQALAALDAQRALLAEDWGAIEPLRVRMALHAGEAVPDDRGDYLAAPLNRLARLLATGHGGQILLSQTVQQLCRGALPPDAALRDLGEHRLRDLLEPERIYQLTHSGLPAEFPPLKSLGSQPNNLPSQPTPFLGREREVAEVVDLLRRPEIRLLTLTGPGGTGKTRLALQAAAELLDDFADGVFFVPLAALTDPAFVPAAIAGALGVPEEEDRPLLDRLRDVLAAKRLLLVIDNFEHLPDAAPVAGELVAGCAELKVLATSRAPLHLRAEQEYPVAPLGLPRRKPPPSLEQLSQYEAVRLFIARAQAVKPGFTVDNASAPAVAEICWRLDGLPLAIELAAARTRLLSPQAMLARLEQRLPLLTGGARDAPQRQRTLRDTIAWSFELLEPAEQTLFRRLAVFAGGASLEAAERVASGDADLDVFGNLERLVKHNMLRQEEGPAGEPRFAMLETIREFGLEQLAASGEETAARDAHAAAMLALGNAAAPHLEGPAQGDWLTRLETDYVNIREAVGWVRERGQTAQILRLGADIKWFWFTFHTAEARQWLEDALAEGGDIPWRLRADALHAAGNLARARGDTRRGVTLHEEELALRLEAGDEAGLGRVQLALAMEAIELGDAAAATPYLLEALDRLRSAGDLWGVGLALDVLGDQALVAGDLEEAAKRFEEALRTKRGTGDVYEIALSLARLAMVSVELGDLARAQEHALAALAVVEEAGFRYALGPALLALAEVAVARADLGAAEGFMQRALESALADGNETEAAFCFADIARLHYLRGDDRAATNQLRLALETAQRTEEPRAVATCLEAIAVIAADRGMALPAARLLGAEVAIEPGVAAFRYPSEKIAHQRASAAARAIIGEPAFTAAYEAGRELTLTAAVAEALALVGEPG